MDKRKAIVGSIAAAIPEEVVVGGFRILHQKRQFAFERSELDGGDGWRAARCQGEILGPLSACNIHLRISLRIWQHRRGCERAAAAMLRAVRWRRRLRYVAWRVAAAASSEEKTMY